MWSLLRTPTRLGGPLLFATLSLPSAQSVLVVDDSGGTPFQNIGQALAAANDGDVVLVRSGTYVESIVINGRSVSIMSDDQAFVDVRGHVSVRNVPNGEAVTLRGVRVRPTVPVELFVAADNSGSVFVEDCVFDAGNFTTVPATVRCEDSVVTFVDSVVTGGTSMTQIANPGLWLIRSTVYLLDTTISGGTGFSAPNFTPGVGGPGVLQDEGFLFATNGAITGGVGGTAGQAQLCLNQVSGAGGQGLLMVGSAPSADLLNVDLSGGDPGPVLGRGTCTSGSPGLPFLTLTGTVTELPWPVHGLSAEGSVTDGSPVEVTVQGLPGELVAFLVSSRHRPRYFPELVGPLLLSFPLATFFAGTLDTSGELQLDLYLPPLPSGAEGDVYYVQPLFLDGLYGFTIGEATGLVVLADTTK